MTDTPAKPETMMQRVQRLQAERLAQMAGNPIVTPPTAPEPVASPLAPSGTPSHERPDAKVLLRLNFERLSAKDGAALQIAALQIVTLVHPMIEWLQAEARKHPHPYKGELEFWATCLAAGVFPHAPPKPSRELSPFESWFYSTIPSIDHEGNIANWQTL